MNKLLIIISVFLITLIVTAMLKIYFKIDSDSVIAYVLNAMNIGILVGLLFFYQQKK